MILPFQGSLAQGSLALTNVSTAQTLPNTSSHTHTHIRPAVTTSGQCIDVTTRVKHLTDSFDFSVKHVRDQPIDSMYLFTNLVAC